MRIHSWQMTGPGEPLQRSERAFDPEALVGDQALVEVAGCGVCHTDLGFLYEGVRTRHPLPLTLGHEISGRVVAAGPEGRALLGRAVVVPAVIPCGRCAACLAGRGATCPDQFFPGNDDHGGFASHVVVAARGLCPVDAAALAASHQDLATLSVIADAVTTPYQAILNSGLAAGDVAIFVGIGGVGGFGVQIARHLGARVVAIDVSAERLEKVSTHGASLCLPSSADHASLKRQVRDWVDREGLPRTRWKIFETSGHPAGQELAYSLLGFDGHLGVVGYTREPIRIRLSNLMAFDATVRGTWGCLPEHYPAVLGMVLSGAIDVDDFVEHRPMSEINEIFAALHRRELTRRPVLVPDFGA